MSAASSGPAEWSGIHVYLQRDARATERVLLEACAPILDRAQRDGLISRWYFLRYWTGGPHLRLRLQGATAETLRRLRDEIGDSIPAREQQASLDAGLYFAAFGSAGATHELTPDATVALAAYEPETERYGGSDALPLAETFFVDSAQLALAVIVATSANADKRRAVAADLMLVFAHAMGWNELKAVAELRQYCFAWNAVSEVTPMRTSVMLAEANAALRRHPTHWAGRWSITAREAAAADAADETVYSRWGSMIGDYTTGLRQLGVTHARRSRAAWSQVHMFMNRLGIGVADERTLAWLVTAGLLSNHRPTDRDSRHDLRYLLASGHEGTRSPGATVAPRNDSFGARVRLGDARTRPPTSFTAALAARRSRLTGYEPRLGLADLRMLLECLGDDANRTYPSPGALYPTGFVLHCRDIAGVIPGTYSYTPGSGELVGLSTLLDDAELEAISPYLTFSGRGVTTDLRGAQIVIVLVTDLTRVEPKYGASGLKLALLEAGHVSQTLLLAAAANGMASLAVGGFDDELLNAALHLDGVQRFVSQIVVVGAPASGGPP